jgi:hypothetical protein
MRIYDAAEAARHFAGLALPPGHALLCAATAPAHDSLDRYIGKSRHFRACAANIESQRHSHDQDRITTVHRHRWPRFRARLALSRNRFTE